MKISGNSRIWPNTGPVFNLIAGKIQQEMQECMQSNSYKLSKRLFYHRFFPWLGSETLQLSHRAGGCIIKEKRGGSGSGRPARCRSAPAALKEGYTRMDDHQNATRFAPIAGLYDACRPACPPTALHILCSLVSDRQPGLVVDLGCGTGLSTAAWAGHAKRVVGVEPCAEMLEVARRKAILENGVSFVQAFSDHTGLDDGCADIVTCSQSFHWMNPDTTIPEIARILRPGGVFAAYDCDWPVVCDWRAELAYQTLFRQVSALEHLHPDVCGTARWDKSQHLHNLQQSGRFRFTREIVFSNTEQGDARRFIGLALSQGTLQKLIEAGVSEIAEAVGNFERQARAILGSRSVPFRFCYRMRLGVK